MEAVRNNMRSPETILTAVFGPLEDVKGPCKPDCLQRHLPLLIDSLRPVITQHAIHPFLSLMCSLCRDSIPINALPFSTLCLSFPKLYSHPLFAFPYTAHTPKKPNYNTSKTIWEQQASHSVGEGG